MSRPEDIAAAEAAFAAGMADFEERQRHYQERPGEGVPIGFDPRPDPYRPGPRGLGYTSPPDAAPVYESHKPGLVPHVLDVPAATDPSAPPSVTGMSHGGWPPSPAAPGVRAARGESVIDGTVPRRRSLLGWLLGRR